MATVFPTSEAVNEALRVLAAAAENLPSGTSVSSAVAAGRQAQTVIHMKKADAETTNLDELRPEYRREDFGAMTRGKYAAELREASNVVVLDADVAKAFPNGKAVNEALRSLLEMARIAARVTPPLSPS